FETEIGSGAHPPGPRPRGEGDSGVARVSPIGGIFGDGTQNMGGSLLLGAIGSPCALIVSTASLRAGRGIAESSIEPTGRRGGCKMTLTPQRGGGWRLVIGPALPDRAEVFDGDPAGPNPPLRGLSFAARWISGARTPRGLHSLCSTILISQSGL